MGVRFEVLSMWLAMALYAGATALYAYYFLSKRAVFSWYATFLTGAGFLSLTASIGLHSSATEGSRLAGPYSIVLAAWAIVLVYFVVEHLVKLKVYGTVLVPLGLVLLLIAQVLGASAPSVAPPPKEALLLASWQVGVHVFLIVLANAGFAIGGVASGAYLALEAQLKRHRTSTLFRRLPSLAQTDLIARRAIAFAYPVYCAGLVLGILRAIYTDPPGWWADPRVMLAGVVWGIYSHYLYLHYGHDASGRTTARVAVFGLVFVIALSIVARTVPAGFHVFGIS